MEHENVEQVRSRTSFWTWIMNTDTFHGFLNCVLPRNYKHQQHGVTKHQPTVTKQSFDLIWVEWTSEVWEAYILAK